MAIATAMAGVASAQAAIAAEAAHQAKISQCKIMLPNFNAQKATVSEMKEYSDCVETLYPSSMGAESIIAFKVLFIVAILGAIYGVWNSRTDSYSSLTDHILFGASGFVLAPIALVAVVLFGYGVVWLFT